MVGDGRAGSAADRAGLRAGDIVLAPRRADDHRRRRSHSRADRRQIGKSVALDVLRGTERLTISLVPQERKRAA